MKERVFLFDYVNQVWYETHDEKYFADDISNLPYIFTSNYKNGFTGEFWEKDKVWCPVHKKFEDIEEVGQNFVKTADGCNIEGIWTQVSTYSDYFFAGSKDLYFRYRVYRDTDKKTIKVEVDAANIEFDSDFEPGKFERIRFTYKVAFNGEYDNLELVPFPLETYRNFTMQMNEDIKEDLGIRGGYFAAGNYCKARAVTTAVLELLQEDAAKKFGFNVPIIESTLSDRISAFLYRPIDSNIAGFKMYFHDNEKDFEKLFPKDQRENFSILCREVGLTASDELRKNYEENPFSIVLYIMLQHIGITDAKIIQKFMPLTAFFGETLTVHWLTKINFNIFDDFIKSRTDVKNLESGKTKDFNYKATHWENLLFYSRWFLENSSEEKLADELLRLNENFDWKFYEAWNIFRRYFDEIPSGLKNEILQSGMTLENIDKLILFEDDKTFFDSDVAFSSEEKNFECKINGYNFRRVNSIKKAENICSRAVKKGGRLHLKDSTIFAVEKGGRYVDIIAVKDGKYNDKMNSTHFKYEEEVTESEVRFEVRPLITHWAKHFGIDHSEYRFRNRRATFKNFVIEPVDEDKNFENLSLLKLLQLPEEKICSGYYIMLYRRFSEVNLCRRSNLKHFDNEKDFLMNLFPLGERIYNAAFGGNAEAQYVLSRIYRCSFCFDYFNFERFKFWQKEAGSFNAYLQI